MSKSRLSARDAFVRGFKIGGHSVKILGGWRGAPPNQQQSVKEVQRMRIFILVRLPNPYLTMTGGEEYWMPHYISSGVNSPAHLGGEVNPFFGVMGKMEIMDKVWRRMVARNRFRPLDGFNFSISPELGPPSQNIQTKKSKKISGGFITDQRLRSTKAYSKIISKMSSNPRTPGAIIARKLADQPNIDDIEMVTWLMKCTAWSQPMVAGRTPGGNTVPIPIHHQVNFRNKTVQEYFSKMYAEREGITGNTLTELALRVVIDEIPSIPNNSRQGQLFRDVFLAMMGMKKLFAEDGQLSQERVARQCNSPTSQLCAQIKQRGWTYDLLDPQKEYKTHEINILLNSGDTLNIAIPMFQNPTEVNAAIGRHNPFGIDLSNPGLISLFRRLHVQNFLDEIRQFKPRGARDFFTEEWLRESIQCPTLDEIFLHLLHVPSSQQNYIAEAQFIRDYGVSYDGAPAQREREPPRARHSDAMTQLDKALQCKQVRDAVRCEVAPTPSAAAGSEPPFEWPTDPAAAAGSEPPFEWPTDPAAAEDRPQSVKAPQKSLAPSPIVVQKKKSPEKQGGGRKHRGPTRRRNRRQKRGKARKTKRHRRKYRRRRTRRRRKRSRKRRRNNN